MLKTAEFMPFVVFIAAPELDTLRAMHKAVVDAGLTTKLLTVRPEKLINAAAASEKKSFTANESHLSSSVTGERSEEDRGRECQDPPRIQPLL